MRGTAARDACVAATVTHQIQRAAPHFTAADPKR